MGKRGRRLSALARARPGMRRWAAALVAARYGTTTDAPAEANGIADPNRIRVGQVLHQRANLPARLLAHPRRLVAEPLIARWAATFGVPRSLLEVICWWESGWQDTVVSPTGAVGICQVEPCTAAFVNTVLLPGQGLDFTTMTGDVAIGAAFLGYLLRANGGDETLAVAGYQQRPSSVERRGPLPATVEYVHGILASAAVVAA